jgi:hypothetical protein
MISFKRTTITVVRPAWTTERGDRIPDWDNATTHTVPGCRLQPADGEEDHDNRDGVVRRWNVHGPAGADVDAHDRVRLGGLDYDVDGPVRDWPSPTGALAHTEFALQITEG